MIYLGSPGRMVGLKCPVSQRVGADEGYRFVTTLEGKRKAQVMPGQRRVWDISSGRLTTPSQVATLMEFASGAWGPGPFWFVPADAPLVNLLPEEETLSPKASAGSEPAGPMRLDDGSWAATSKRTVAGSTITWRHMVPLSDPPVLPGVPVTASAWVEGTDVSVRIQWQDNLGSLVGSSVTSQAVSSSVGTRIHVTGMPPEGAVQARMSVINADRATRPAVTWTDQLMEWGEGQGCPKAVVHAVSRDLVRAVPGSMYSGLSFTISEVG